MQNEKPMQPKMRVYTPEELATNEQTQLHVDVVIALLDGIKDELTKRGEKHDASKFHDPELAVFTTYTAKLKTLTYNSKEYKQCLKDMKPALDHHYRNNSHHPEFYDNGINDMDIIDLVEMFVDWKAATLRHDDGDIHKSIDMNKDRFQMSEQLCQVFKNSIPFVDAIIAKRTT